jgi:hypothetical protein
LLSLSLSLSLVYLTAFGLLLTAAPVVIIVFCGVSGKQASIFIAGGEARDQRRQKKRSEGKDVRLELESLKVKTSNI